MKQSKGEPKTSWVSLVAPTERPGHTFSVAFAANACYGSGKPWLSVVKHGVTSPPPEGHPPSEAGKEEWSGGLSVSVSGIQANKEPVLDQGRMSGAGPGVAGLVQETATMMMANPYAWLSKLVRFRPHLEAGFLSPLGSPLLCLHIL